MSQTPKNLEILNISNTSNTGLVVLNDQHLLELIQKFPFLYNPSINPQNDPDYNEWAWECMAKAFNRSYLPQVVSFNAKDLETRWNTLQPIILSLSKSVHAVNMPVELSNLINVVAKQMGNLPRAFEPTLSQKIILDNIPWVERLSFQDRRKLEGDIMELLIETELKTKANLKLNAHDLHEIESEYDEFLQVIRLKELFVLSGDCEGSSKRELENGDDADLFTEAKPTKSSYTKTKQSSRSASKEKCEQFQNFILKTERTATGGSKVSLIAMNSDNVDPLADPIAVNSSPSGSNKITHEEPLLQPLEPQRFVPLNQAHMHVRRCRVLVKRVYDDEMLPLAFLKREKVW